MRAKERVQTLYYYGLQDGNQIKNDQKLDQSGHKCIHTVYGFLLCVKYYMYMYMHAATQ